MGDSRLSSALLTLSLSVAAMISSTKVSAQVLQAQVRLNPAKLEALQGGEIFLNLNLAPGFKAYEDQFRIQVIRPAGFLIANLHVSPLKEFFDKPSGKTRKGVFGQAILRAAIEAPADLTPGLQDIEIRLTYQACTDTYCLFPKNLDLKTQFEFQALPSLTALAKEASPVEKSIWESDFQDIFAQGLFLTFVFVFLAGILTSFTPCIFPMIPITLAVLGRNAHTRTRTQNFLASLMYVMGIAVTYSVMGVVAASTGALFGSFMSHPLVLGFMCLVFLAMALSMFGLYELQAPAFIQNRFASTADLTGFGGAFISGAISGVVASPCVGPVLVGILTYIAKTQNLILGAGLMFAYALGMGQIFLVLGLFSHAVKLLPKSGPWLDGIKTFFGLLMMGVFYYFLNLLVPIRAWDVLFGLGLSIFAGSFGAFIEAKTPARKLRKALMQSLVILGGVFLALGILNLRSGLQTRFLRDGPGYQVSASNWKKFTPQDLENARLAGKPVILDFSADWCAACKELEQFTFSSQRFQLLSTQFILLKFDATQESPELEALRSKYGIVGLPTILFFNKKGEPVPELTLTAFEEADAFIGRLQKILK